MTDENCLFCRIARHEIPVELLYEDGHTLAFLDIHPRAKGHTLVISKTHSKNISDLPEGEIAPLFLTVRQIATLIRERLEADGLTLGINDGSVSGQEVDHLHVHIMPRFEGDGGGSIQAVVNNPPHEFVSEVRMKIKK